MNNTLMAKIQRIKFLCSSKEEEIYLDEGLGHSEFYTLMTMPSHASMPISALVKAIGLSPSRGGRVINSLVKKAYFKKRESEVDARVTLVELTKKGEHFKNRAQKGLCQCEDKLSSQLGNHKKIIMNALDELATAMENSQE